MTLAEGAKLLRAFAADDAALLAALDAIVARAPFRRMVTPGGHEMSVGVTNCGALGWTTDRSGYRYTACDPASGRPWPPMPEAFVDVAARAADAAGFAGFRPDACLMAEYQPGARLTLHQDRNEADLSQPVVSVSLGLSATFLLGGAKRSDRPMRVPLQHGDVAVWGGPARLRYHGVLRLAPGHHPALGARRINLSFRKAGAGARG